MDAAAGVVALLDELNLHGDVGFDLFYVADDAYVATALAVKCTQGMDGVSERLTAQRAEAFVDEEGIYRKGLTNVGQCKGQGQRYEEALTTTERVGTSGGKALVGIFERDVEGAWYGSQGVAGC